MQSECSLPQGVPAVAPKRLIGLGLSHVGWRLPARSLPRTAPGAVSISGATAQDPD